MKRLFSILILLFIVSVSASAQRNVPLGIPKRVYFMQMSQYPKATDLVWKILPDSTYSTTFKLNGKPGYVHYAHNSAAIEAQAEIDSASLPRPVVQMIDSLYPGYKYQSVSHFATTTPLEYKETFLKYTYDHYQISVVKGNSAKKLYFSPEGKLLNWLELQNAK